MKLMKNMALLLLFVITASLSSIRPYQGQSPRDWQAWLYSPGSGTIKVINRDGVETGTIYLPLTQAFNAFGQEIVVSPNGRYVAYTAFDNTREEPNLQLFVYDRQVDATRFAYDLSGTTAISFAEVAVPTAFDENRQRFAFAYLRDNTWEIVVADLINESVIATLDSGVAASSMTQYNAPVIPIIQNISSDLVGFTVMFHNAGNLAQSPAYVWNITSGDLSETNAYGSVYAPVLPATGEVVIPTENANFPAADRGNSSAAPLNTLDVFTPDSGTRSPFYNDAEKFLRRAYFIQDGAQVLVETVNPASGEDTLKVINRDGSVAGEFSGTLDSIIGTPEGFAGTFPAEGGIALAHVNTTTPEFNIVTLWTTNDASMKLVHIQGLGTASSQSGEWHQLGG